MNECLNYAQQKIKSNKIVKYLLKENQYKNPHFRLEI